MPITPVEDGHGGAAPMPESRIGFFAIEPNNMHMTGEYMLESFVDTQMLRVEWSAEQQRMIIWALVPEHAVRSGDSTRVKLWLVPGCDASSMNPYTVTYLGTVHVPMDEHDSIPWHVFVDRAPPVLLGVTPAISMTLH